MRLSIFMSHPIQYQVSLLKKLANIDGINLNVYFYWDFGCKDSYDPEFNNIVKWDLPLLDGYKYSFLRNFSLKKGTHFFGCINFGVIIPILFKKQDVVMIFGWALFSNWLVVIAALISRTPILLFAESPFSHEVLKKSFLNKIRRKVLKGLFSLINGFLYIGKENKMFYKSYGIAEEKLFFVPYAVDNERHFKSQKLIHLLGVNRDIAIEKDKDSIVVLFVGKLIEKKRPLDLLKSFKKLQEQHTTKKILLWFVGNGTQLKELEKYVLNHQMINVKFWGFQNQTQLPHLYALGDIFVLPSGYGETWGLVVNEAMCYGKPIIVSDLVGCGADLVTLNNGFIVPYGDTNKMADALKALVENEKMRNDFGKESRVIINKYSQEIAATQIAKASLRLFK